MAASALVAACTSGPSDLRRSPGGQAGGKRPAPARAGDGLAQLVESMSDAKLAGQAIMTMVSGTSLAPAERRALSSGELGGIILFGFNDDGGGSSIRRLTSSLPSTSHGSTQIAPLVAADQEGGAVRALKSLPPSDGQEQLGDSADGTSRILLLDRKAGRALRRAGISITLAPVADLPLPPAGVMRGRSFGADPALSVAAAVRGFQSGGVAATAKHFPGLGGATRNTDEGVARVSRSRAQLQRHDLAPFRAAARAGVDLVMTSHAIYRGLGSTQPGTVDPKVTRTLLREQLGDDVIVISDSLNARGLRDATGLTTPQLCPAAAAAGVDLLLLTGSLETARLCRRRLLEAMRAPGSGVTRASLERSARRLLELKSRLGLLRLPA